MNRLWHINIKPSESLKLSQVEQVFSKYYNGITRRSFSSFILTIERGIFSGVNHASSRFSLHRMALFRSQHHHFSSTVAHQSRFGLTPPPKKEDEDGDDEDEHDKRWQHISAEEERRKRIGKWALSIFVFMAVAISVLSVVMRSEKTIQAAIKDENKKDTDPYFEARRKWVLEKQARKKEEDEIARLKLHRNFGRSDTIADEQNEQLDSAEEMR